MKKNEQVKRKGMRVLVGICILFFSVACSKEEVLTKEEINEKLLVGPGKKTWLIVSATFNGTEYLPKCVEEDHWIFRMDKDKMNKVVSRKNITTSCSNGLADNQTSSWSIANNGSWLTIFGGTYEIIPLTENEMVLEFPRNGNVYIDTFKKK